MTVLENLGVFDRNRGWIATKTFGCYLSHPIDYFVDPKCFLKRFSERANRELSNGILLIKIDAHIAEIALFEAPKAIKNEWWVHIQYHIEFHMGLLVGTHKSDQNFKSIQTST